MLRCSPPRHTLSTLLLLLAAAVWRCTAQSCTNNALRLVGGATPAQGRVEICLNSQWGTVCDDLWGTADAQVVCRQLGYSTIGAQYYTNAYFGQGTGPIQLDNVNCAGTEQRLIDCSLLTSHNCGHHEDAGVACTESCATEGGIRLVGGTQTYEGRVELCTGGQWTTVCDDYWGSLDAQVACRQLGYSTEGALAFSTAYFGQGAGPILLDNVHCAGNESTLLECNHLYNQSNCAHSADAGVRCQPSNATTCLNGDLRLVNGQNQYEGRVEICLNNVWGTVCDDSWSSTDARVVCRQLGYGTDGAQSFSNAYFGQGTGPIQIDNVGCGGSESVLVQCNHLTIDNCGHHEDAGARCSAPDNCTEGDVRLVGGQSPNEGRVEMCLEGQWGTVCDDFWGSVDAQVACRQLGYLSSGAQAQTSAYYGQGTGPIQLDNVQCTGSEVNLLQCSHSTIDNCGHSEDAGIRCRESCSVEGAVRLVGGQSDLEGRVEYCSGGVWGTVCDTSWDAVDAGVVCNQLGHASVGAVPLYNAQFGQGAGPVIINTITCTSSAQNISQCTITTPSTCSHSNDAGLRCEASCSVEGSIRLVGGDSQREGTVEVCQNGVFGTVCDDQWGTPDAAVVCRQLGYSFDVNLYGTNQNTTVPVTNYGKEFYIGFMRNYQGTTERLRLVVSAEGGSAVQFGVKTSTGVVYTGTTTASSPVTVNLLTSQAATSSSYSNRNKGVYVYTIGAGSISVLAINYKSGTVGDYLAYPCQDVGSGPYEYFVVSTRTLVSSANSEFLLVGCEDATTITITPTQSVSIPTDAQSTSSSLTSVSSGANHQITLNKMQTLLVLRSGTTSDLTGSRIVSNKPLTVISGHECANVPSTQTYCEHLSEHIPPTSTWGQSFLLVPFGGRNVGQYFKIVSSQSSTTVSRTCNSVTSTQTLSSAGNSFTFFTSSATYCYVASNKPIMVSQLGIGGGGDNIGDPIISILPSLDQYTNSYTFFSLNTSDFNIHQISVSVLAQYYQPNSIKLDGQAITASWSAIYNSGGTVVGYGCRQSVTGGVSHTVRHDNPSGKLAVVVHGWNSGTQRGYGYLAGLQIGATQSGNQVAPTSSYYGAGSSVVQFGNVQCVGNETSLLDCTYNSTAQCSSTQQAGALCPLAVSITQSPVDTSVNRESSVTLTCTATGVPTPSIMWYKQLSNGTLQPVVGTGAYSISAVTSNVSRTSQLTISNAAVSDNGNYVCRAFNLGMNTTSDTAYLTVIDYCTTEGQARLVGGSYVYEGRVEVCVAGAWSTVCDQQWGDDDAQVVCRQLGYLFPGSNAVARTNAYFGQGIGTVSLSNLACTGSENFLVNCTYSVPTSCTHGNDAGVTCPGLCPNGGVRLVGGTTTNEGRVEVCNGEAWGTVCDDYWGSLDAQVVCNQLGYSTDGALAFSTAYFGQGTGPILLDNVHCAGNESSLLECNHLYNQSNCAHSADAGVRCQLSNATTCLNGDLRLVNGQNQYEGRVEICLNNVWGTVCDDSWSSTDARVVCRQLGYGTDGAQSFSNAYFGQGTGPIQIDNVGCGGSESVLVQCYHLTIDNCGHHEDAGARCSAPDNCTEGDVRLVGGQSPNEGRVEICLEGQWGTVCDDFWGSVDAQVACRQLGYLSSGALAQTSAYYGQGTGPIQLDNVQCTGSEVNLLQCSYATIDNCGHSEDAGIRCRESCSVEGAVRLVGGQSNLEGRVEYCSGGVWGTVCDTSWDAVDAGVVCNQLGHASVGAVPLYNAQFGQGAGPVIINTITCTSSAQNIGQCTITTPSTCSHSNDAGLRCQASCGVEGSIRLVGGDSQREGTVEVCQNGVWGTVCDDQWGTPDAAVACRQLGYQFDVNLYGTNQNTTVPVTNYGKEFYIGFMRNYQGTTERLRLVVSAEGGSAVQFGVKTSTGVVYTGTTTASSPVTVNLPTSQAATSSSYSNRNKGVYVYTIGAGAISVLAVNYKSGTVGDYLAYPCQDVGSGPYEYFVVSTRTVVSSANSEFLLVGCEDATTITITPTQSVSIPTDAQSTSSSLTSVSSGANHQITLNKMQTLLVLRSGTTSDLTGSRIVSNKPLTVISGHECANVPSTQTYCEHLSEHIPPTSTWGQSFLLVPFGGRNVGQYFKIVSSQSSTTISRTCNSVTSTQTLSSAGNSFTFFTSSTTYCYVASNKPILVSQLGIGGGGDNIGDPIISILPSLDQYTNSYTFFSLNTSDFNIHQISVSVLPQYYQPSSIRLDGQAITATWSAIYNSGGTVVGYGCRQSVTGGVSHTVRHDNPSGKLAVLVHGWNSGTQRGYGYLAGLQLGAQLGSQVAPTSSYYGAGSSVVQFGNVQCVGNETSLLDCTYNSTAQCSSTQHAGALCPLAVSITQSPVDTSVNRESSVTLTCTATGVPTPSILWYKQLNNGTLQSIAGAGAYSISAVTSNVNRTSRLTISNAAVSDTGNYLCRAYSLGMNTTSDTAYLTVIDYCTTEGQARLVGGSYVYEGRVEVCVGGVWSTVCDQQWGDDDAQVVCRQLGYLFPGSNAVARTNAYFGQGFGTVSLSNLACTGSENFLVNCTYSVPTSCTHGNDAGVTCPGLCPNGGVRLVGGTLTNEGRVEVCNGVAWGTVCDDFWGSLDAQVVCNQLGYSTDGTLAFSTAYFGQGTGPILLDNVHCAGNESSLLECNHLYNQSNCAHSADAGVRCQLSNATTCLNGDLRLVNGQNQFEGRVEICLNNVWGTVCDDSWSSTDARVVCRQLGYGTDGAQSFSNAYFGQGSGPIQIDNVGCGGSESVLVQCYHLTIDNCGHHEDAGARCTAPDNCTEGDLRLVGGQSPNEGRVEICLEGQWGTVCDDFWGSVDAQVACSQLGYLSTGALAQTSAYYGQGTGPIQLDNVQCTGSEVNLLQCSHSTIDNCGHSEDAGIRCRESCSVEGAVRLVGGQSDLEGRVEYCSGGVWGTVCDTSWDAVDAGVICNQLGYPSVGAVPLYNAQFGQGAGPVIINTITCTSSAQNISQCTITTPSTCSHSNDAGLRCAETCDTENQVRLIGGDSIREGRVEICSNGTWGTVCDNFWNQADASVVCQQLGYSSDDAIAFSAAYFGQGAGSNQFGSFLCSGAESSLVQCPYATMTCSHTRDAGVRCRDNTTSCTEGQLRLVGGTNSSQGRVEVCSSTGTWGTVCDDLWGSPDAQVVCRQLGYPTTGAIARTNAYYGQGTGAILYDNVQCSGSEYVLEQCTLSTIHNCGHYEDAGVSCRAAENCTTGAIRLVGGNNVREGRVEVCVDGQWGTICDNSWTSVDAQVVCSQIGQYSAGVPRAGAYYGQGTVPVFFDSLTCKGSENQVTQCSFTTGTSCAHSQDVGVQCVESCSVEGSIRLVGGVSQRDGTVEVCQNGVWGTVCDDQWGTPDAAVVCRQLGYSFDVNLYGTNQNTTVPITNYGKEFYIGFMRNYQGTTTRLRLVVSAEGSSSVQFGVKTSTGVVYTGTTTASSPVTVNLPTSQATISSSYSNRNKGVYVYTIGAGSISVLAVNYKSGTVGDYLAYPCQDVGSGPYEYFAVSTRTLVSSANSEFLLVGCEDATTITITPTQSVSIPTDAQSTSSSLTSVSSGANHQITLNKMQTLLVLRSGTTSDLTGSRIVSDKPLTVISGHECANVPSTQTYCEHLSEHIPPTSTWGQSFFLVPFGGRSVGQYFKIVSSQSSTTVSRTCNSVTSTQTLSSAGNSFTFFTSSATYCYVASNKPILVSQLGIGGGGDNIGDPIISILPSLDQYTNSYTFFSLNTSDFNIHQISVSVLAQYYQPNSIKLDGQAITASWSAIYNSGGTVVGYGCRQSVTGGVSHTVRHDNPSGKLAVLVHGWNSGTQRGYGYLAGLQLGTTQSGSQVALTSSYYGAGSSVVQFGNVQCVGNETSLLDCTYNSTAQCSSTQQAGVLCPAAAQIVMDAVDVTVDALTNATFSCSAFSYPAPSIMWYRQLGNGSLQQLTNTSKYSVSLTVVGNMNQTSVLMITKALLSDAGTYVCQATSSVNNDTSSATLTVLRVCNESALRLVGGESEREGTVEVCQNGVWGPVCDDQWDVNDAAVVCRALGYSFDVSALGNNTVQISNYGKEFYIGFMQNFNGNSDYLRLIVRAEGSSAVQFGVRTSTGVVYTGTTTASSPKTVNLPTSLYTASSSYANRNKGIYVYTIGAGAVSVLAVNFDSGTVGDYLAYPCQDLSGGPYEYFAVSTGTLASSANSAFLLVGCEDNTTITITPTQSVSIPTDAQSTSSSLTSVSSGANHQITLNKMQTLYVEKNADLTGSRIVSDKPLTVISGHECGNVPSTQTFCEHLTEHIPPTSTWGQSFLLVPFGGRNVGQYFKIVSSQSSTTISRTCNSVTSTQTLSSAGNSFTFFTSSTTYCYVASNKPILVSQLGRGGGADSIGDPIISILPSLDQYTNSYTFSSLNTSDFNIHQISVSVLAQYYQPNSIRLDGQAITATWSAIYNSGGTVVGYGCRQSVTGGVSHTVRHDNPSGKLAVVVHGWNSGVQRGYGYLAGLSFNVPRPVAIVNSNYGSSDSPFQFSGVQCVGNESSLFDCPYSTSLQCPANSDAGVVCPETPIIYQSPQNTTANENDTVTFNCSATGVPAPTITWYKQQAGNTLQLLSAMGSYTISSTTLGNQNVTSTLTISQAMLSDAGRYVCRAASNGALATSSATLTVVGPPQVMITPPSSSTNEFSSAVFICTATEFTQPTISWYSNIGGSLVMLTASSNVNIQQSTSGDQYISTLTLVSAARTDAGQYVCSVTSQLANATATASLTVYFAPTIYQQPQDIVAVQNDTAMFTCSANGLPRPDITWLRVVNGLSLIITASSKYSISTTPIGAQNRTSTLVVSSTSSDDATSYICRADNTVGSTDASASLAVQVGASITPSQSVYVTNETYPVTFQCTATSTPSSDITWYRNGTVLSSSSDPRITVGSPSQQLLSSGMYQVTQTLTITNTADSDSGNYSCVGNNSVGTESATFTLVVQFAPRPSINPQTLSISESNNVVFTCTVPGLPKPNVNWFSDASGTQRQLLSSDSNVNIAETVAGAVVTSVLTLTSVTRFNDGNYICSTSNQLGNATVTGSLSVLYSPEIYEQPQNQSVAQPSTATFVCSAVGHPRPTLTWQRLTNGVVTTITQSSKYGIVNTPSGDQNQTSTLMIFNTSPVDNSQYTCFAENIEGNTQSTVTLSVRGIPIIYQAPQDTTVSQSATAVFNCSASGQPTLGIEWFQQLQNGTLLLISNGGSYSISSSTAGMNLTSQLSIATVTVMDAGTYVCRANSEGLTYSSSSSAVLTVLGEGDLVITPAVQSVVESNSVVFNCSVNGLTSPVFTWYSNIDGSLVMLTASSNIVIQQTTQGDVSYSTLTLVSAARTDAGQYVCSVTSQTTNGTTTASLTVYFAPTIYQQPQDVVAVQPNTATFTCSANGLPRPDITWLRVVNGLSINIATSSKYSIVVLPVDSLNLTSTLVVSNTSTDDATSYVCRASNVAGSSNSSSLLTVQVGTSIETTNSVYVTNETSPVTFQCTATGIPTPNITWYRNGTVLSSSSDSRITVGSPGQQLLSSGVYQVTQTLTITNTADSDSGNYSCVGSNTPASDTATFALVVQIRPVIVVSPADIIAKALSDQTFRCSAEGVPRPSFSWIRRVGNVSKVIDVNVDTAYSITYQDYGDRGTTSMLYIANVSPFQVADYVCVATNLVGQTTAQASLTVYIVPSAIPDQVTIVALENSPVTFQCQASGIPSPTISWYRNGAMLSPSTDPRISLGVPTQQLQITGVYRVTRNITINSTATSDAGVYSCVGVNQYGNGSNVFTVTVQHLPKIDLVASAPSVAENSPVTFTATVTALPAPNVTWYFKGIQILSTTSGVQITQTQQGDQTISKLMLASVLRVNAGQYTCKATNVIGSATNTITLPVRYSPIISEAPQDQTTIQPASTTFTCTANSYPAPIISWLSVISGTSTTITNSSKYSITNTEVPSNCTCQQISSTLIITNTTLSDVAQYVCQANNSEGSVSSFAAVTVQVTPRISSSTNTYISVEASPVVFQCTATGVPTPSIIWIRNGATLSSTSDPRITVGSPSQQLLSSGVYQVTQTLTITNTADSDSGNYSCVGNNSVGMDTSTFMLAVRVPPVVSVQLTDQTSVQPNTAMFTCTATGLPRPSFQWTRTIGNTQVTLTNSSQLVISETNAGDRQITSVLTLAQTSTSNTANYTCTAQNTAGSDSSTASLNVYVTPQISSSTNTYTSVEASPVVFQCTATGVPTPSIIWIRNGATLSSTSDPRITVGSPSQQLLSSGVYQVTQTLTITNTADSDSGNYSCVGNNSVGTDTSTFVLAVRVPPVISVQLTDQTSVQPNTAMFTCTATGLPRPSLQWTKTMGNTQVTLTNSSQLVISETNVGDRQITSVLTLAQTSTSDTANYTCTAQNVAGSDSSTASLNVYVTAVVRSNDPDQVITTSLTTSATLSFGITGAVPPVQTSQISWIYSSSFSSTPSNASNVDITGLTTLNSNSQYSFSNDLLSLTISNIVAADDGRYFLSVTTVAGSAYSYIDVVVEGAPVLVIQPQDQTVLANNAVNFTCEALAYPLHDMVWIFNGSVYLIATNDTSDTSKYSINRDRSVPQQFGSLTVSKVQYSDRGLYQCIAINSVGSVSASAMLTVHVIPSITAVSPSVSQPISNSTTIYCLVRGYPAPTVAWLKDSVQLASDSSITVTTQSVATSSQLLDQLKVSDTGDANVVSVLQFSGLRRADNGVYSCEATNSLPATGTYEDISDPISVIVLEVPSAPASPSVSYTAVSVYLKWSVPTFIGNSPVLGYRVYQRAVDSQALPQLIPPVGSSQYTTNSTMFNITSNIIPYTRYEYGIEACNAIGCSNRFVYSVLRTSPSAPGSSPRNCQVTAISSTSISVSWDVPVTTNGLIQYYTVISQPMQSLAGQDLSSVLSTSTPTPDNSTELVLTQLLKATSYTINITASTVAGTGPSSTGQCTTYTLEDVPDGQPLSSTATADTATSIRVTWNPPDVALQNGRITGYKLLYTTDSSQREDLRPAITTGATVLSYRLTNLQVNTRYFISIAASTSVGFGPYASLSTVTLNSPPPPPDNVRVGSIQDRSINVTWNSVAGASQYMVYYQPDKSYQVTDRSYDSSEQSIKTVSTQVTLSGLYPGSTYTVKISSVNAVGTGAASTPVTAVLPPAAPDTVPKMTASTTQGIVLNLQKPSNINGELSHYQLVVVYLPTGRLPAQQPDEAFPETSLVTYSAAQNTKSRAVAYVAAEFSDDGFPAGGQFVIGDRNQPNDYPTRYTNGALTSGQYYTFFLRAFPKTGTIQKRQSDPTRQYNVSSSSDYTSPPIQAPAGNGGTTDTIAGLSQPIFFGIIGAVVVVVLIFLIILIAVIVIVKRSRPKQKFEVNDNMPIINPVFENRAAVYDEFEDDWDLNMRAMQKEREMNAEPFSDTTDEERYQTVGSALKHQPFVSKDYSELAENTKNTSLLVY